VGDGTVLCSIVYDITDRVKAEQSLRDSESHLKQMFASLHEIVSITSRAMDFEDESRIMDKLENNIERQKYEDALRQSRGKQIKAAEILGMSRITFGRHIKRLRINPRKFR
jgi:transcriptional regulator with GAF, ATPase, and Fis domain